MERGRSERSIEKKKESGMEETKEHSVSSKRKKNLDCDPINPSPDDAVVPMLRVEMSQQIHHNETNMYPINQGELNVIDQSIYELCGDLHMVSNQGGLSPLRHCS